MRRLDFLLIGFLIVLLTSCGKRVQNAGTNPAVKIDTVLSADKQIALQFPGRESGTRYKFVFPGEWYYSIYACK